MNEPLELLGGRLRDARERAGLSQRELAHRLEVSPSFISLIETGKSQPSVGTLWAIVSELGVSLDELFGRTDLLAVLPTEEDEPAWPVVTASQRKTIELQTGVRWELLTREPEKDVDFVHAVYEVGGASTPDGQLMPHAGREYGYVISGTLGIQVGFEEYVLTEGCSIAYDSTIPHRLFNAGDVPVHAIWIVVRNVH